MRRIEESLNKQLKCGSHPNDPMSTGEGVETRSVSSKLGPARERQDGMERDFLWQKIKVSGFCTHHGRQNSSKDRGQVHQQQV